MKVLVVGAYGQLGRELLGSAPPQFEIQAAGRETCDIRDAAAVKRCVDRCRPGLIINAAGYTAVDRAETEREAAYDVNAIGAGRLAVAAEEQARGLSISRRIMFLTAPRARLIFGTTTRVRSIYGKQARRRAPDCADAWTAGAHRAHRMVIRHTRAELRDSIDARADA